MPDTSGAADLSQTKTPPTEAEELPRQKVDTAFVVVLTSDGSTDLVPYDGDAFLLERTPTPDLIASSLFLVQEDLRAAKIASASVEHQVAYAQMVAQQRNAQAQLQGLDPSKLRVQG